MIRSCLHSLSRDNSGATLVEFAFVAPTLLLMIMGIAELGHGIYIRAILDGTMEEAGRLTTLETAKKNEIGAMVEDRVQDVVPGATVALEWRNFQSYEDVGQMEEFSDINGDGICNDGEPFEDTNDNDVRDHKGKGGIGNGREAVLMTAVIGYDRFFPMPSLSGWSETNTVTSATVLRNQPYSAVESTPEIKSCPIGGGVGTSTSSSGGGSSTSSSTSSGGIGIGLGIGGLEVGVGIGGSGGLNVGVGGSSSGGIDVDIGAGGGDHGRHGKDNDPCQTEEHQGHNHCKHTL